MKELFPLNTFQQDAVLKRLEELREELVDIEDGDVELPNVKPVYYHPITIRNVGIPASLSLLILDNNSEPYTKETFLQKINDFQRIAPLSGAVYNTGAEKTLICGYAFKFEETFYLLGVYTDGVVEDSRTINFNNIVNAENTTFSDGINKIN